ncbi:MAG TPA: cytochrome c oxidase subunit II [Polyangia bacterium]|nr:cytochrome c oxidase subunit II [Polyangia bacterium]
MDGGGSEIAGSGSALDARSPQAAAILHLFTQSLVVCGAIFFLVVALIVVCVVLFRSRPGREASRTDGDKRLEIGWTLVPSGVLIWLLVATARAMTVADPTADRPPDLTVVAHQWWWEARYPSGAVAANEIHVPAGRPLVVRIESADVVHDFWAPSLGRKIDAIPGRAVTVWLQADRPGIYLGTCAEYCGAEHAWMRIRVVAQTPAAFTAWEAHERLAASAPSGAAAARGARMFGAKTCVGCHAIRGTDETRVGPDLTHLAERATLATGAIDNNPSELARWLKDPQRIKPGCHMPNLQLADGEVNDLVAYLETLR